MWRRLGQDFVDTFGWGGICLLLALSISGIVFLSRIL